jgi:hypothetical protein
VLGVAPALRIPHWVVCWALPRPLPYT